MYIINDYPLQKWLNTGRSYPFSSKTREMYPESNQYSNLPRSKCRFTIIDYPEEISKHQLSMVLRIPSIHEDILNTIIEYIPLTLSTAYSVGLDMLTENINEREKWTARIVFLSRGILHRDANTDALKFFSRIKRIIVNTVPWEQLDAMIHPFTNIQTILTTGCCRYRIGDIDQFMNRYRYIKMVSNTSILLSASLSPREVIDAVKNANKIGADVLYREMRISINDIDSDDRLTVINENVLNESDESYRSNYGKIKKVYLANDVLTNVRILSLAENPIVMNPSIVTAGIYNDIKHVMSHLSARQFSLRFPNAEVIPISGQYRDDQLAMTLGVDSIYYKSRRRINVTVDVLREQQAVDRANARLSTDVSDKIDTIKINYLV